MEDLAVWYFFGTEIPYPSSQTKMAIGTCNTAAAFIVSQKCPSEVEASPTVTKQTSLPLSERSVNCLSSSMVRKDFEARARPSALGIWPAVGAISEEIFFLFARSSHSPFSSTKGVAK